MKCEKCGFILPPLASSCQKCEHRKKYGLSEETPKPETELGVGSGAGPLVTESVEEQQNASSPGISLQQEFMESTRAIREHPLYYLGIAFCVVGMFVFLRTIFTETAYTEESLGGLLFGTGGAMRDSQERQAGLTWAICLGFAGGFCLFRDIASRKAIGASQSNAAATPQEMLIPRNKRLKFVLLFVAVTSLAKLAFLDFQDVEDTFLRVIDNSGASLTNRLILLPVTLAVGAIAGAVIGTTQAIVLSRYIKEKGAWIGGTAIASALGYIPLNFAPNEQVFNSGIMFQMCIGVGQWLILRKFARQAGWLILAYIFTEFAVYPWDLISHLHIGPEANRSVFLVREIYQVYQHGRQSLLTINFVGLWLYGAIIGLLPALTLICLPRRANGFSLRDNRKPVIVLIAVLFCLFFTRLVITSLPKTVNGPTVLGNPRRSIPPNAQPFDQPNGGTLPRRLFQTPSFGQPRQFGQPMRYNSPPSRGGNGSFENNSSFGDGGSRSPRSGAAGPPP